MWTNTRICMWRWAHSEWNFDILVHCKCPAIVASHALSKCLPSSDQIIVASVSFETHSLRIMVCAKCQWHVNCSCCKTYWTYWAKTQSLSHFFNLQISASEWFWLYEIKMCLNCSCFVAPRRLGGGPECVCLAREAWRDQEDDGDGSQGHWEAGGNRGDGGYWQTEGQNVHWFFLLPSLFNHHFCKLILFYLFNNIWPIWPFMCVHAATLWRRDPPATYRLGSFGVRPRQEDCVHLRPSWCPASQHRWWLGHRAFHSGGERWWEQNCFGFCLIQNHAEVIWCGAQNETALLAVIKVGRNAALAQLMGLTLRFQFPDSDVMIKNLTLWRCKMTVSNLTGINDSPDAVTERTVQETCS